MKRYHPKPIINKADKANAYTNYSELIGHQNTVRIKVTNDRTGTWGTIKGCNFDPNLTQDQWNRSNAKWSYCKETAIKRARKALATWERGPQFPHHTLELIIYN